ncbi:MAG TPA: hypothetical protein VFP91_12740 [Vicinamibacterales bacterium]|nr:hypothetical protein [Vicinamibacterales bacterium]
MTLATSQTTRVYFTIDVKQTILPIPPLPAYPAYPASSSRVSAMTLTRPISTFVA